MDVVATASLVGWINEELIPICHLPPPPSNILGSRRGRGSAVGMSSITVRRDASWSSLLSEVVLRKAIIMHRCSAAFFPLLRRSPRVTKNGVNRSVQSTSPLLRVAFPLLLATDIQIKEPTSLSTLHVATKAEENISNAF